MANFLYRALRPVEIKAGNILIPHNQHPFKSHPSLPIRLPFFLGKHEEHAAREHQHEVYPYKSGVSTSTTLKAAKYYSNHKVIVKIDRNMLKKYGIKEFDVSKCYDIRKPDDNEVILHNHKLKKFPKDIIVKVLKV